LEDNLHVARLAAQVFALQGHNVAPFEQNLPGGGFNQAQQHAPQGGLPQPDSPTTPASLAAEWTG
jgi:hypothetical protein